MATYVMLANYHPEGMKVIDKVADRIPGAKQLIKSLGGELKSFYWLMGQYDAVVVVEAPDDETVSRIALTFGKQGTIDTTTMRAFSPEEMTQLVKPLREM
jgi:uncharacterized protein with GYD domain